MKNFVAVKYAFLVFSLTATAVCMTAGWAVAGQKPMDEIRAAVERSALSGEARTDLLVKAESAVRAGVPPEDVEVIVSRGLKHGVEPGSIGEFLDIAGRVKEQDLPVRLVLSRIEQGLSKGVPPARISVVAKGLAENLSRAHPIVNHFIQGGAKPAHRHEQEYAVETVARALEKSIPEETIAQTAAAVRARGGSLSLFDKAVDAMTNLVGNGMPAESATRLVQAAVDKGYTEKGISRLEKEAADRLRMGGRMDEVVTRMESDMDRGGPGEGRRETGGEQMRGPASGMERGHGAGGRGR